MKALLREPVGSARQTIEQPTAPYRVACAAARDPFDPARILGCTREEAGALFDGRAVTPGEAEAIAEKAYPWRRHLHDPTSYWITTSEAARLLHTSPQHVKRLLAQGRLPHVVHDSGVRLMRRRQIEALAELGCHVRPDLPGNRRQRRRGARPGL